MLENIMKFFKKFNKKQENVPSNSRETAKERLHLVLMQDRANVSADFLELMKQEIELQEREEILKLVLK